MYKFFLSDNVFSSGDSMLTYNSNDTLSQKEEIRRIKTQKLNNKLDITEENIAEHTRRIPQNRKKIVTNILKSCDETSDITSFTKRYSLPNNKNLHKHQNSIDKCSVKVNFAGSKINKFAKTNTKQTKYQFSGNNLKQENVDIICTDLSNLKLVQHILDTAKILQAYDYQVTIVTTKSGHGIKNSKNLRIIEVGNSIPDNFLGAYHSFFYTIRSIYLAIWYSFGVRYWNYIQKPIIIFCESSTYVLPILHYSGIKTAYFQYLYELLKKNRHMTTTRIKSNIMAKFCLSYANAILLPNKTIKSIYFDCFKNPKLNLHVLYPFLRSKKYNKEVHYLKGIPKSCYSPKSIVYLTLGEFNPRSNFELAIESFDFLLSIVDDNVIKKLYLILSGHCSKYNLKQIQYYEKILNMARNITYPNHIIVLKHSSLVDKKALMKTCSVYVHTAIDEIFNPRVLEAMSLAKPIIASDSGFMKEAVADGTTGYLVEPYYTNFAFAMNKYIVTEKAASIMGNLAQVDFLRKYTLLAFGERLRKFIKKVTRESRPNAKNIKKSVKIDRT